ncbi:MAG: hypothetical protein OES24_14845 [Acidimicrobiia bacterium]|nr:hypothetical protein [Acidimicrobiia bacterium]
MEITEFAAIIVAIAVVVAAVFLITAVNNLNNTLAKLEDTANHLRTEGIAAFRELRQLVADADAELDKVDIVLDRADQATTAITETTRRTHEAAQDPMIRTLAVVSGSGRMARRWMLGRRRRRGDVEPVGAISAGGDQPRVRR